MEYCLTKEVHISTFSTGDGDETFASLRDATTSAAQSSGKQGERMPPAMVSKPLFSYKNVDAPSRLALLGTARVRDGIDLCFL